MSGTVIDSLLVTLGIDPSGFTKGRAQASKDLGTLRKDADTTADHMARKGAEAAEYFSKIRTEALKMLTLLTGSAGFTLLVTQITEVNAQLGFLSKNLGEDTRKLQAWGQAAQFAGGSAEGMESTMSMLSASMTEMMVTGNTAILPYMRALNVSMADAAGNARPLDDILTDLSERFSGMNRPTANNIGKSMGIDQGSMNLLLMGPKAIDELIAKQKELYLTTLKDAEASLRLKNSFTALRQEGESLAKKFMSEMTPHLEEFMNGLLRMSKWVSENKEFVISFFTAFATILAVTLVPSLIALAKSPFALITTGITLLAGAFALLLEDWKVWKAGGESLINWGLMKPGVDAAIAGFNALRDAAHGAFEWMDKVSGGALGRGVEAVKEFFGGGSSDPRSILKSQGWTDAQASGIIANLMSESNMDPAAEGDFNKKTGKYDAYGILQWHPDRQADFEAFSGKSIRGSSVADQLAFLNYELRSGKEQRTGNILSATVDARGAAEAFSRYGVRPSDKTGAKARARGDLAASYDPMRAASPAGARALPSNSIGGPIDNSSATEVHIGTINLPGVKDAQGFARELPAAIGKQSLVVQADQGLT